MKRTLFSLTLVLLLAASANGAEQWAVCETSFTSAKKYDNPFVDVEVDVVFQQGNQHWKVPAFWSGPAACRIRAPRQPQYQRAWRRHTARSASGRSMRIG